MDLTFDLKALLMKHLVAQRRHQFSRVLSGTGQADWATYFQGLQDASRFLEEDDFDTAGKQFITSPPFSGVTSAAGLLYDLTDQYTAWFGQSGLMAAAFPVSLNCLRIQHYHLRITAKLDDRLPASQPFFKLIRGQLRYLPLALGLTPASVIANIKGRQAIYEVSLPASSRISRLWSRWRSPAGARQAATLAYDLALDHVSLIRQMTPDRAIRESVPASADGEMSVVRASLDGIVRVDHQQQIVYANPAFSLICGYPEETLSGMPVSQVLPVIASRPADGESVSGHCVRQDQALIPVFVSLALTTPLGEATWVVRDLTEETRFQLKQRQLSSQLQAAQKMDALGQLTGGVVHDFNNLLLAIRGHAELAQMNPAAARESIGDIINAAQRGNRLTRSLLDYGRRETATTTRLDLGGIVSSTLALIRPLLPENITIIESLSSEPVMINGDEHQIEQILMNLVVNARDAMPSGGQCRIEMGADQTRAKLLIADTGQGMTPEIRDRIFEPLFTTKPLGTGTGLGLSVVAEQLKSMQGKIHIESEPGSGTSVHVEFPLARHPPLASDRHQRPIAVNQPGGDLYRGSVLIVEDNEEIRALTRLMLKGDGYDVMTAADGRSAMELLREGRQFDAVLLDVVLPGMSGRKTAEHVRRLSPGTQVLFMSAYPPDSSPLAFIREDNYPFIAKPFGTSDLRDAMNSLLGETSAGIRSSLSPPRSAPR